MRLAIMQPYLFPYLGYFQLVHAVDRFVFGDDFTFIKGGWINRNRVLVNNEPAFFTVPLKQAPSATLISDVLIDDAGGSQWRRPMLKTIENFYRRAPHFSTVFPIVQDVLSLATPRIADMARTSVVRVADYLGLDTHFVPSSTQYGNVGLKGQDRVIDICEREHAAHYINAIGGRDLYDRDTFAKHGITLSFIATDPVEYRQFRQPFTPALSMIDVLMFNSREDTRALLNRYQLV